MIGIQICMLRADTFEKAVGIFRQLHARFGLSSCEIHLERSLYPPAIWPWETAAHETVAKLRSSVAKLGIHLPFMDLNPVSSNPRIAETSLRILEESLDFASLTRADYSIFHARGCVTGGMSREQTLIAWQEIIARLAKRAMELGVVFCLENADDLRDLNDVRVLQKRVGNSVMLCLDLGHLFERKYASSFLPRMAYVLNDRLSPFPFLLKKGLPAQEGYDWSKAMGMMIEKIACVHLHNHDGRTAHRRLSRGKINLDRLKEFRSQLQKIPVILEVDYSHSGMDEIEEDLRFAEELL
jgi:sugar phosphate isomerase/epimerase